MLTDRSVWSLTAELLPYLFLTLLVFIFVTLASLQQSVVNLAPGFVASSLAEFCSSKYLTPFIQWLQK